jgi:Ni,Fe-hydrogenase III small subunit
VAIGRPRPGWTGAGRGSLPLETFSVTRSDLDAAYAAYRLDPSPERLAVLLSDCPLSGGVIHHPAALDGAAEALARLVPCLATY